MKIFNDLKYIYKESVFRKINNEKNKNDID